MRIVRTCLWVVCSLFFFPLARAQGAAWGYPPLPPPGGTCPCECSGNGYLRHARPLPPRTTDVIIGADFSWNIGLGYADGGRQIVRGYRLDARVVRRLRERGIARVSLDPISILRETDSPLRHGVRVGALIGRRSDRAGVLVGVGGWTSRSLVSSGTVERVGGVHALVRLEFGRPLGAMFAIEGGTGSATYHRYWASGTGRAPGFAGEAQFQFPFPAGGRELSLVRLTSRWFGAGGTVQGDAGFDFVLGRRIGSGRPAIAFGYRWIAWWDDEGTMTHALRIGAEWYGLGGSRAASPPPS